MKLQTLPLFYNDSKELWKGLELEEISEFLISRVFPKFSWRQTLVQVKAIKMETPTTRTFVLQVNHRFSGFKAGQHATVTLEKAGKRISRTYSFSSGDSENLPTITVKRQPNGLVSNALHDQVQVGDILELGDPQGSFLIPEGNSPVLYIAGGSGITPIFSHISSLVKNGAKRQVHLLYFSRSPEEIIFRSTLQAWAKENDWFHLHLFVDEKEDLNQGIAKGRVTPELLLEKKNSLNNPNILVCGPIPLKEVVLRTFGEENVKSEVFGFGFSSEQAGSKVKVKLNLSHREVEIDSNISILEGLEKEGIYPPSGCRMGICHSCVCEKKEGQVIDLTNQSTSGSGSESIRICVSKANSNLSLEL
jgi:stearoyl-CoA 9-desaturase NADPH oxidoreductase